MANAGVVLKSGKLIIPSFERTLAGTTAISCKLFILNRIYRNEAYWKLSYSSRNNQWI